MFFNQVVPFTTYLVRQGPDGRWSAPATQVVSQGVGAVWSNDGTWIAYVATQSDASAGPVMLLPTAGGVPHRVFDPSPKVPGAVSVLGSPDGRTLYYKAHDPQGDASLWAVSAAGGVPRMLVHFTNPERQSSRRDFATDGKRFYFAIEDRQGDVFVAEMLHK